MSRQERTKVLYIAGASRSGSTILGNVLGQYDGFFSVGELSNIWEKGLLGNRYCGCGEKFLDCETWKMIVRDAFGGPQGVDAVRWSNLVRRLTRSRAFLKWGSGGEGWLARQTDMQEFLDVLRTLYLTAARVTGSRIIVDGSKIPMYGASLSLIDSLDVRFVHLIRDPRAVAYSRMRPRQGRGEFASESTGGAGAMSSYRMWILRNQIVQHLAAERPERFARVRYEDFVRDPGATMASILVTLGEDPSAFGLSLESRLSLRATHTVSGNPNRFDHGVLSLVQDTRWRRDMPVVSRVLVSLLSAPWLIKYGYAFWPRRVP